MRVRVAGLILAWIFTRVWVLLSGFKVLPYPKGETLFNDVVLYDWWAANILGGNFPVADPMWQYPPLAALVFIAGYLIAPESIGFVLLATSADLLIFYFLLNAGLNRKQVTLLPAAIWVSTALLMGPIMLGRFDVFPTLFAVIALIFATRSKIFGTSVAIGSILKIWPILLFFGLSKSKIKHSAVWFINTVALLSILLTIWWPESFSFLAGQRSRGLQIESVAALPFMLQHPGPEYLFVEFRFGAIELNAIGTAEMSLLATLIMIILVSQIIYWRWRGYLEQIAISEIAIYVVTLSILTSRVFSPQYMIWIFGLLAVCALHDMPNFKRIFGLVAVSAFMGQVLYPGFYNEYMNGELIPLIVQVIRIFTLIAATYLMWANLRRALVKS